METSPVAPEIHLAGAQWQARRMMPQRRVIRWFERNGSDVPEDLIASFGEETILTQVARLSEAREKV
jgi:hypothetical protein